MRPIVLSGLVLALAHGTMAADVPLVSSDTAATDWQQAGILNGEGYYSVYDYACRMTLTVSGYTGEETLTDFPVFVTVANNSPSGFRYDLFKSGKDDLRFFDSSGRSLNYEVVQWNTSGKSSFWVHVPMLAKNTTITMCWNLRDKCSLPGLGAAATLWSDYVGVWHMDESITSNASTTYSADATGHGLDAVPNKGSAGDASVMTSTTGVFGNARINDTSSRNGNFLEVPDVNGQLDIGDTFTISLWLKVSGYTNTGCPQIVTRRQNGTEQNGYQIHLGGQNQRKSFAIRGQGATPAPIIQAVDTDFRYIDGFTHVAYVFSGTTVTLYANGVKKGEDTINAVNDVAGDSMGIGNRKDGTEESLYGQYDEVRLFKGEKSADWIQAEYAQGKGTFFTFGAITNDTTAVLKNTWVTQPTITKSEWQAGTHPTREDFVIDPKQNAGTETIVYYNRATGACLGEAIPTAVGDYRAVITVAESGGWGGLGATVEFRIVAGDGTHDLGINVDRVLLMNDDYSVEGGTVEWQSYDYEEAGDGMPYWRHLDEYGTDVSTSDDEYWSDSADFNLGGGTIHEYWQKGKLYWYLWDVRVGNTFNNGDFAEEWEEDEEGLADNQNYLPWNPDSQPVVGYEPERVGPYHQFAGQIVMRNTLDASIYSSCYTNGLGTIYFDAVNGWTDNITNAAGEANYALEVQISTNVLYSTDRPTDDHLFRQTYTGRIIPTPEEVEWHTMPMRVLRFMGEESEDLGETNTLALTIDEGKTCRCFYRVIVPVHTYNPGRFRIRRVAIDKDRQYSPDDNAYILVDNVICSTPSLYVDLKPYGRYVEEKAGKQVLGCEAAFDPAFPTTADEVVRGRAKATMSDGTPVSAGSVTSATMHYRWHYLEQKTTEWFVADLNPATFVSLNPLTLPPYAGDIDFWYDLHQSGNCYQYADYSGTGKNLGKTGYTEAVTAVTNRSSGVDWFVRMRDGRSDYAEMKLLVKTSEDGAVTTQDLYLMEDYLWRGMYRMTEAVEGGIYWRIEPRDAQTSGATAWNYGTNYWSVVDWADELPTLPSAGRMSEGDTNSWSRMPCGKETGYLTFQIDETTRGITVVRSDYQDFNTWSDAAKQYFTGSSVEDATKKGTSANVQTFDEKYTNWTPTSATNSYWNADMSDGTVGVGKYSPGYTTFSSGEIGQWDIGYGQWVYGKYLESSSHVAYQMRGCGMGYLELADKEQIGNANWPRGIDTVSFDARIAQTVEPNLMAYSTVEGTSFTNYAFMVRTCFDMKQNKGFSGNASVSLFGYYRDNKGAYEARWEQVGAEKEKDTDVVLGPAARGQRLVISRWNKVGSTFKKTDLYTVSNEETFKVDMPTMPYNSSAQTNNLMPFCISVFQYGESTIVVAGVRIGVDSQSSGKGGVSWSDTIANKRWYLAFACDSSSERLTSGEYGVLSANCEGLFLTPEIRKGAVRSSEFTIEQMIDKGTGNSVNKSLLDAMSGSSSISDFKKCHSNIRGDGWSVNEGRELAFYGSSDIEEPYGFAYAKPEQTINVYTAPMSNTSLKPTGNWTLKETITISGFGSPYADPDYARKLYIRDNVAIRLKAGGETDDYRTDVAIANVVVSQLCGRDDWSTSSRDWDWETDASKGGANNYGYTNVVFTSGWVTNGAVRLSAKRTQPEHACSVRSPLFDGNSGRAIGLGSIAIKYREPQSNVKLKVQFVTNYTYRADLKEMSRTVDDNPSGHGNGEWFTVTNLDYKTLMQTYDAKKGYGEWKSAFGFHGARGMMRIVMDNDLVEAVEDETDTSRFGEIDILEATCRNEPALDKDCWWGWNIRTLGDACDTERRMYLPDGSGDLVQAGQSFALNNSVTDGINPSEDADEFKNHMPFLQSPTFTNGVIGQVSFRARKYDLSDLSPTAQIAIYGAPEGASQEELWKDSNWDFIAAFPITNTLYTTYTYKTDSKNYRALRLGVVDVEGTLNQPEEPEKGAPAQRVLLDEVTVSEAVRAVLSFCNVGAFRTNLNENAAAAGVMTKEQQPLCNENWGIQAELVSSMLGDEIDTKYSPRVTLHWYVGETPWGFSRWRDQESGQAELAQADGSNYVYRSSYSRAPEAIMQAQETPGTVVQYMLEVEYRIINSSTGKSSYATNWLDSAAWTTPSWYAPIDFNADAQHGAGRTFAAYTILDDIAPGWAWINEVNVFGKYNSRWRNTDEDFQYVEICVPAEADLTDWRVRLLAWDSYELMVTTNNVAIFGTREFSATKKNNVGAASNMVFRCIGNKESERMKKSDGTLDGVWAFDDEAMSNSLFDKKDGMYYIRDVETPFGVQLVRPSGIIEHSVVVMGTNGWEGTEVYDPNYIAKLLNSRVPGSKFFYAGPDQCGESKSDSVIRSQGESASVWTNDWQCSPGRINTNLTGKVQQIDPNHPYPTGDSIVIYASVDTDFGHITQHVGSSKSSATNALELIVMRKGSDVGTNIYYQVDRWYEMAGIVTNNHVAWVPGKGKTPNPFVFNVGRGASNNVTVVASAQVKRDLAGYGLTEDNVYTPAVMDWLVRGSTLHGSFKYPERDDIALADYVTHSEPKTVITNLTLTQMYWLDMDPTVSNMLLEAGLVRIEPVDHPVVYQSDGEAYRGHSGLTNVRMSVFMMISNRHEQVNGKLAWSPYVLRGIEPQSTSWTYEPDSPVDWTSETFKVTGILANGYTREDNPNDWVPLRWFVFKEDSFYQPGEDESAHPRFTTDIEIVDPHSSQSPAADKGWYAWFQKYGYRPVFNSWSIDAKRPPVGVEVLRKNNYYEKKSESSTPDDDGDDS